MAGKFRRKFIDIVSDRVTGHYQGKVPEKSLQEHLEELRALIGRLEQCRQANMAQRSESLKRLRRVPLEELERLLAAKA